MLEITKFVKRKLEETKQDEIGLSYIIRPYAIENKLTFEAGRGEIYRSLDAQELIMNPLFTLSLGLKG